MEDSDPRDLPRRLRLGRQRRSEETHTEGAEEDAAVHRWDRIIAAADPSRLRRFDGLGGALLLGEAKHTTDNLDPIVADALPRDTGEALRFAFLASEFCREFHGGSPVNRTRG
jgi:hypothetical protein